MSLVAPLLVRQRKTDVHDMNNHAMDIINNVQHDGTRIMFPYYSDDSAMPCPPHFSLRIVIATTFNSSPGHPIDNVHQHLRLLGFLGFISCIQLILYLCMLCRRKSYYFTPSQVMSTTTFVMFEPSHFVIFYYKLVLHNDCHTA